MTRSRWSPFSRAGRSLAYAGAIGFTLLVPGVSLAVDGPSQNTVFKSANGDEWVVSIKPTRRIAHSEPRTIPVPPPADILPAVAQQLPPAEPPLEPVAPNELPPVPVITTGQPGTGATTAYGVTVLPTSSQKLEVFGRRYADAYRSIPFNRAEYNANPSYRHEAAMELLFGQMRPTTIVKQMPKVKDETPAYSPYKPFVPAYGDYSSYQSLPLPYPLFQNYFNQPNGCVWPNY